MDNLPGSLITIFESLFQKSKINIVLLMDPDGTILWINKLFTECFGYQSQEIIGKNSEVLFTPEDRAKGLPALELKKAQASGQATDKNFLVHFNGSLSWVSGESISVEIEGGRTILLKIIQDIQSEKTFEQEVNKLTNFNENILSTIEDIVIIINRQFHIIKFNQNFSSLFITATIRNDLDFYELVKDHDKHGLLMKAIEQAFEEDKRIIYHEMEIVTINGERKFFNVSCMKLKDEPDHLLLVVHDITVHKLAEHQREDIIGFVAHELRNPLANIILCNDLLGDMIKNNNVADSMEVLSSSKSSVLRLNKMIRELYDATKISGGNITLEKADFNFQQMVKEAISTIQQLYPAYKIEFTGNANINVNADKFRLIQVITNYLSNGIKYSQNSKEVHLHVEITSSEVIVRVTDYGMGIERKQLPFIFSRFFRADKTRNLEGTGLGLYLCKQIVEAHHGKVWVVSEESLGSTFYFSIPVNHTFQTAQ